ncbi:RNI-like protein [Terfezia boudieri ATCC MYA-4762]|uniref:RNI-like protein n=1 Tax=Terfezia boudieri ATCC MYA-4762 TaxID=1051890 RepID=A0A3N4LMX3_9PEZI|nr:RNI-like protein [Terfezia boudieri ATCC MYA-4762]
MSLSTPPPPSPGTEQDANAIEMLRSFDSATNPTKPIRPSPLTTQNGMPLDLLERLRSFPLFQSAPDSFLTEVAKHLRPQTHSPRDYIITEGDEAKAMYWLVRGVVVVTSRDGESTFAELKAGAFFGEIGILMEIPRTATIIAKSRCLLVVLSKEALRLEMPKFPEVERAIRDEAEERLMLLNKKKQEREISSTGGVKRSADGDVRMAETPELYHNVIGNGGQAGINPASEWISNSALEAGMVYVRQLLKELPLFASLPPDVLHFLGLSAQPKTFAPFNTLVQQASMGRDIFFIVRGEVEVIDENPLDPSKNRVKARLKKGQYFGEVAGLSYAPRRTATVRSVSYVECLVISGNTLSELWTRCPPEVQHQVEMTARTRLDGDPENILMSDAPPSANRSMENLDISDTPQLTLTRPSSPLRETAPNDGNRHVVEPFDPDPFLLSMDFDEAVRSKSRRGSLAPPNPGQQTPTSPTLRTVSPVSSETPNFSNPFSRAPPSPSKLSKHAATSPEHHTSVKRARILSRKPSRFNIGSFRDDILIEIFKNLELHDLMRLRQVSTHWSKLLTTSPALMKELDLKKYNRLVTDAVITSSIAPFVGHRPEIIDISNCYHLTDEGFIYLAQNCGKNVKKWKMKSVWDITGQAILEMSNRAKELEEIDLSNCRKVSDTLLARVVGWLLPPAHPPPGTVIGCPNLRRLTLSYCKHVTDRTMSHLAAHASKRLEHIDLTRCTTITDAGFQYWSMARFDRLTSLCLADCTYLTDSAIVFLTTAARGLKHLDLSFCCALSDTATEVLSLGCPGLETLDLSFCGSAVSDQSLRAVGLHLLELRKLSVRGCVRVTGVGVEAVVEGCCDLRELDVSQCKNLVGWLERGGVERFLIMDGEVGNPKTQA